MTRSIALAASVAAALCLSSATVAAQSPANEDKARDLFEEAEANYAAGSYEEAADLFLQAYELSGYAELLFNVANCYERMGEYKQAAAYLRRYLDSGEAEDVVSVRQRIRRLDLAVKRQEAADADTDPDATPEPVDDPLPVDDPVATTPTASQQRDRPRRTRATYWWLGASAVALASGVGFSIAASAAGDEASERCNAAGLCQQSAEKWVNRERRFAIAADVSYVTAAAAGAVGFYLLLRKPKRAGARGSAGVHPIIVPGGIGIGLAGEL